MNNTELNSFLTTSFGLESMHPASSAEIVNESLNYIKTPTGIFAEIASFRETIMPCRISPQPEQVLFKLVTQGEIRIKSRLGDHCLPDSSLTLMPWNPQFEETFSSPTSLYVIGCNRRLCQHILPLLSNNGGMTIQLETTDLQYLTHLITRYIQHADKISNVLSVTSSQMIISSLGEMLVNSKQSATPRLKSRTYNIIAIKNYISANLNDATLDAEKISEHVRLSVNYMNRLLAEENLSLMKLVWEQRLAEAQRLLLMPNTRHMQMAEVAWLCGFSSQSHFSQAFKKRYGLTPREMRATHPH